MKLELVELAAKIIKLALELMTIIHLGLKRVCVCVCVLAS